MKIELLSPTAVLPLRRAVLRPGRPAAEAVFAGDDHPATLHLGIRTDGGLVGIATLMHEPPPGDSNPRAWRLRGMAVAEKWQRQGLGGALLQASLAHVKERGGTLLWFNARTCAVPFYRRHGFETVGDEFEIAGVGPHCLMRGRVT
jgi:predicted GNAT family N-acyltransferase